MAAIDIGLKQAPVDSALAAGSTYIVESNPANLAGKITSIDIKCYNNCTGIKVAIFQSTGTNKFTARSVAVIGDLATGLHEGVAVDLAVEIGDYIGVFAATGNIYAKGGTSPGDWYLAGDQTACEATTFSTWNDNLYLWGDGKEPGAGGSRGIIIS